MKKISVAALLLLVLVTAAEADSLEDFNYGIAASNHGDTGSAITLLSRAISAGDLSHNLQPVALVARGDIYRHEHKYPEAIADYSTALKLKPEYFEALLNRAQVYLYSGDMAAAASDCLVMAKVLPYDFNAVAFCGRLDWQMGDFVNAGKKLKTALEFSPNDQYIFLWLSMALLRSKRDQRYRLSEFALAFDQDMWPSPLVALYLGAGSLERAERKAGDGDDESRRNRACEVGFYGGEWQLLQGNAAAGLELLQQAADLCKDDSLELQPAKLELERLRKGETR